MASGEGVKGSGCGVAAASWGRAGDLSGASDRDVVHRIYRDAVLLANGYKSRVTKAMREVSHDLGLPGQAKFAHYDVMCELYCEGVLTPSEISDAIGVTLPNVLNSINGLVELGLVERSVDERDRRRSEVRLTDLGRRFGDEITSRHMGVAGAMMPSREEAESLVVLLDRCVEAIREA